jgi:pyruvate formate lyase activating enzyme
MTVEQVLDQVRPWVPYLDGITFSGGECTLQWEFLLECLPRLRGELGLPVLLDSNGNMPAEVLECLLPETDGLLFDLKALDPQAHRALTGCGNERILANLARAAAAGKVTEVRTVLIPGVTDEPATVLAMARLVAGLGNGPPLRLSRFRPQGVRGPWAQVAGLAPERFRELCGFGESVLGARLIPG